MNGQERLERIQEVLIEIDERLENGAILIVEGKKDRESLLRLGIRDSIMMVSQMPLLDLSEAVYRNTKDVILLTDWDRRGDQIASLISKYLRSMGLIPDCRLRGILRALVKKEIKDVESLDKYVMRLESSIKGCPPTGLSSDYHSTHSYIPELRS